jgi:hypothetical protein
MRANTIYRKGINTALLLLTASITLAACGKEQDPVNRIEAYALPKALFAGEWFYQKAVVDVPGAWSIAWVDMLGELHRIRWDIQEGYLYARKSYEQVQGAKHLNQDTGEYLGEIVGAWRITSHFDIKRSYNPTTGEESNILEENASDCKWYDCKYMRVDWSTNLATDQNFLYFDWPAIVKQPIPFSEQDASDPKFKPIFDAKAGYIDVTSALAIAPGEITFSRWNVSIPACWLFDDMNCTTEVVKVRNSFWRRDPNWDYEPRPHRGKKDEWFGYFVTERFNWYAEQGLTYWAKQHYMNRHNIWDKSHTDTACTEDAQCPGSRCDKELPFHKQDVATDSDADGLPDAFEATVEQLDPSSADSNGNGIPDNKDDTDGNGVRDVEDFWAWDRANLEYRCLIPMKDRDPAPVTYFAYGFPPSLACDEANNDTVNDKNPVPCKKWEWAKEGPARDNWSILHRSHQIYNDSMWRVYLRGAHGWSDGDYQKWISTYDPNQLSADQKKVLAKFGDDTNGYYAWAICPNNPVQEHDPWPCRFPRHSFAQAKELMDRGLKFNHLSYELAKAMIDADQTVDQTPPRIRAGDLRYSILNYLDQYTPYRFLGVAQWASDPRTGEIISGYPNISSSLDFSATRTLEMIELLNGKTKATDYVNGVDLAQWVDKVNAMGAGAKQYNQTYTTSEIQGMYGSMKQAWMQDIPRMGNAKDFENFTDEKGNKLNNRQLKAKLKAAFAKTDIYDPSTQVVDLSAIKGTPLEKMLINREILLFADAVPFAASEIKAPDVTAEMLDKGSIARENFWLRFEGRSELMRKLSDERNMTLEEMVDDGLMALALRLKNDPPDKLWAKLRRLIGTQVIIHEMGHTVGLQHNKGGSEDVLNFPEEYWRLRTNNFQKVYNCKASAIADNMLCPFFLKGQQMTDAQRNGGLYDQAYASTMDYTRIGAADPQWLGRYDNAALMFGYGDKVEVFEEVGTAPASNPNVFEEWWDGNGSVLLLYSNRAQSYHYTNWYPAMKDLIYKESNRRLVDYREVNEVIDPADGRSLGFYYVEKDPASGQPTGKQLVRVPYVYCKRTSENLGENCLDHDQGSDPYEKMKTLIDSWNTWYVIYAFPRYRYSPWSYVWRRMDSFYSRLKDFNNGMAYYQALFPMWYDQDKIDEFFSDPVNGYGSYTVAIQEAFNVAMRTMLMPDIGYYENKKVLPDGQVAYRQVDYSTPISTGLTNARYFATEYYDTNYEQDCGMYWWECLHHMGFYLDKIMALMVLSDPRTYFVGQDTAEDIRRYRISFFDNFTDQIIDHFGAILSNDYDKVAPWYDPSKPDSIVAQGNVVWDHRVAWRNYANPTADPAKPPSGGALEAGTRFTFQLYAAVLGMFRFQGNFNSEFIERGRLWKKGKSTTYTITPTSKIAGVSEFVDPFNGSTYVGINYNDGRGIAQRMIARANKLKGRTKYCTPAAPLPPQPADVCVSASAQDQTTAEGELRNYKDLLDVMVQVTSIYDTYGHNWSWNPYNP